MIDWQITYGSLTLGPGTPYGITSMPPILDAPPTRNMAVDRPGANGAFPGPAWTSGRIIEVQFDIAGDAVAFPAAVTALIAGTQPGSRLPLTVQVPGQPALSTSAVCLRRALPIGLPWASNLARTAAVQFYAADPRMYGPGTTATVSLRTGGTGLAYPLAYPLTYGTNPSGGVVSFVNTGTAATEPAFTIAGPLASGFEITHVETGRRLRYVGVLGSPVLVDCAAGTVTQEGQQRSSYLTVREWFSVPAGAAGTFAWATLGAETTGPSMTISISPAYL